MEKYQQTFDTWNKLASLYEQKFMNLDLYNESYDHLLNALPTNAQILDVGCGPGNISRYFLTKRPDLKITGIDTAPAMIELAKQNNPSADFIVMEAQNITSLNKHFDAVVAGFCIPYLDKKDLVKFIEDSCEKLMDNGWLYLSFVEGNYEKSGMKEGTSGNSVLFHYYSLNEVREMLQINGFMEQALFETEYPNQPTPDLHRMLLARK